MQRKLGGILVWQWLILLSHALLYCLWWRNSVFYADDGIWFSLSRRFYDEGLSSIRHLFASGQRGSLFRHSHLAPFLHLIPYNVVPRVESVLVFVAFLHLATQWAWMRIGHRIGRPAVGTLVACLYFWTPSMLCYYGLRLWQIVYLPMAVSMFAISLLAYAHRPSGARLWAMVLWVALACHFHMLSGFLFAVIAICFQFHVATVSVGGYAACVASALAILAPVIGPIFGEKPVLVPVALAAVVLPWFARSWKAFAGRRGEIAILVGLGGVVVAALWMRPETSRLPTLLFHVIAAPSPWLSGKFRLDTPSSHLPSYPVILFVLATLLGFSTFSSHGPLRRAVFWLNVAPACFLMLSHVFHLLGPHQYFLILLPGIWLAIALLVFDIDDKSVSLARPRVIAGLCLVAVLALNSVALQRHVSASGGEGMRCSSLGTKLAVIDALVADGVRPIIVPLDSHVEGWWHSCLMDQAWRPLVDERTRALPRGNSFAYLSEPRAMGYVLPRLSELARFPSTKIGSVVVYRTAEAVPVTNGIR